MYKHYVTLLEMVYFGNRSRYFYSKYNIYKYNSDTWCEGIRGDKIARNTKQVKNRIL